MELPRPEKERWTALRAGVVDVWDFDRQDFIFHKGRLILRGRNESGKSKTLELLLPFLLDASLRPDRLGAERNASRKMVWNLLNEHNTSRKIRTGYVWLEFGRIDDLGVRTLTIGSGLHARREGGSNVQAWFFITPKRIGTELSLTNEAGEVVTRRKLPEVLGDGGRVYDSGGEYRRHVNRALFHMEEEQYDALIHTLLELRQPKLSKNLNIDRVGALLSESLPPLDAEIIGRLATDFEELEEHRRDVADRRRSAQEVKGALKIVKRYAVHHSRQRADALTSADSQFHKANSSHRDKQAAAKASHERVEANTLAREDTHSQRNTNRAALDTLKQSDAYRAVQDIAQREKEAEELEGDLTAATANHDKAKADADIAKRSAETQEAAVCTAVDQDEDAWSQVRDSAVAVEVDWTAWEVGRAEAEAWNRRDAKTQIHSWMAEHDAVVAELRRLDATVVDQLAQHATAESRERVAHEALTRAREQRDAKAADLETTEARFWLAVRSWFAATPWSADPGVPFDAELDPPGFRETAQSAVRRERDRLQMEDVGFAQAEVPLRDGRERAAEELEGLQQETHAAPDGPRWQRRDRPDQGAPFYMLCDFRENVPEQVRSAVEGALLAAGLLDAWVTADGAVEDAHGDVWAATTEEHGGRSLSNLLRPVDSEQVPSNIIEALLRAVPVVDDVGANQGFDTSGGWRLGVLVGHTSQERTRFVGASARERERQRRMRELQVRLERLGQELRDLAELRAAVRTELASVEAHWKAYPTEIELLKARAEVEAANGVVTTRQSEADDASRSLDAARRRLDEARNAIEESARRFRREAWLLKLDELVEGIHRLGDTLREWSDLARDLGVARRLLSERQAVLEGARERVDDAKSRLGEAVGRLDAVRAEVTTLRAALGKSPEEVLAQVSQLEGRDRELEATATRLETESRAAAAAEATAQEKLTAAADLVVMREQTRDRSHEAFVDLARSGLPRLALGLDDDPPTTSLTEAIETARQIAKNYPDADVRPEAGERAENRLITRFDELRHQLPRQYSLEVERRHGVAVVTARTSEELLTLDVLERRLREQLVEHENLLEEEEGRVLADFLTGTTRRHLRERLVRAQELVDRANAVLDACPTPQGTRIRLKWRLDHDAPPAAERAVGVLRLDSDAQNLGDRKALKDFLQSRLAQARLEEGSLKERMLELLDYRRWHCFDLETTAPGKKGWNRLTRKAHGAGSGGQKAVLLHLPLFAAAAAFYDSASDIAPRLVLMDEAFAGVDTPMRAELLGLLCTLDLDFVLTSHSEWGCYPSVDGTAIYHLSREKGMPGVLAERYVWDGTVREAHGDRQ